MDTNNKRLLAMVAFSLTVGGFLGAGGMAVRGEDVEERTKTEIVTETKYVYRTIYKTEEKKEERKEERKDIEKERIVERKIAVPCKCKPCSDGSVVIPSGTGILGGNTLGLDLPEGYYVIEERIGEKERDGSGSVQEAREESKSSKEEKAGQEDKTESLERIDRIEKAKTMDWIIGVRVEYGFGDKELNYGLGVKRRIVGPLYLGVSGSVSTGEMDKKANVKVGGDVSVGF